VSPEKSRATLLARMLACSILAAQLAQPVSSAPPPAVAGTGAKAPAPAVVVRRSQRAEQYYARRFGVDQLQVLSVSSGAALEFHYRVLDASKAQILGDKRATPSMINTKTGAKLSVPTTKEKVGAVREVTKLEPGHQYSIVFSNTGKRVKPGDRVDVVVGSMRFENLTVE
jgi:hypothetical protein